MKEQAGELPKMKKLPLSSGEFPDENWSFIDQKIADKLIESRESEEALFYEGARTLLDEGHLNERVQQFFQTNTDGHFPNFPFLKLPPAISMSLVKAIRDPENSILIGPKFSSRPLAVDGILRYALDPELEIHMEQIAYEAASQVSDKVPDSEPEDFMPARTPADKAVNTEMNRLMASANPRIDRSRCSINLDVDFTRSTTEIVREFDTIITREKNKWKQPEEESRGKTNPPYLAFRELAIFRLFKRYESVEGICNFLDSNQVKSQTIYRSPKGWNDARDRAIERLDRLKQDHGGE